MSRPRVLPRRIQLKRQKGWRLLTGAVVVARPTRWGNPYVAGEGDVGATGPCYGMGAGLYDPERVVSYDLNLERGITAEEAVLLYRRDLECNLADDDTYFDELREALGALRGKPLACWCRLSAPCHADVLLDLANR